MSYMKKAIGVIGFIGAVCIGFSISTAAGIVAIILSWVIARKLEARYGNTEICKHIILG